MNQEAGGAMNSLFKTIEFSKENFAKFQSQLSSKLKLQFCISSDWNISNT